MGPNEVTQWVGTEDDYLTPTIPRHNEPIRVGAMLQQDPHVLRVPGFNGPQKRRFLDLCYGSIV